MEAITYIDRTYIIIVFLKVNILAYYYHNPCLCYYNVSSSQLCFYYSYVKVYNKEQFSLENNILNNVYEGLISVNIHLTQHYSTLISNIHDMRPKNMVFC